MDDTLPLDTEYRDDATIQIADEKPWARLVSLQGGGAHELTQPSVTIGRENADIVVGDKRVSKLHCKVALDPHGAVMFTDLSTNGSLVAGKPVKKTSVELHNGDEILLARPAPDAPKCGFCVVIDSSGKRKRTATATGLAKEGTMVDEVVVEDDPQPAESAVKRTKTSTDQGEERSAFEENLCCGVCYEFMHRAVSVLPCLHNFCGSCLSAWWSSNHKTCPTCRVDMTAVKRNHQLNNIVETYLEKHPDKRRSKEELDQMDAKNTFTEDKTLVEEKKEDKLKERRRRRHHRDDDDDDEDDEDGYDDDDDDRDSYYDSDYDSDDGNNNNNNLNAFANVRCIECDSMHADGHMCKPQTQHTNCRACFRRMPIRTAPDRAPVFNIANEPNLAAFDNSADPRPQWCALCRATHCNLYFPNPPCNGAPQVRLVRLRDFVLQDVPQGSGCSEFERQVLVDYLASKNQTAQDIFALYMPKLDDKSFEFHAVQPGMAMCGTCCTAVGRDALFDFRMKLPKNELPPQHAARPDCWYGTNCRTMKHNPAHASKLNHMCTATR